jgi:hypothetical protein
VATGPSLTQRDVDACRHLPVIAINDAWELAPWARWLFACDLRWWDARWNAGVKDFAGEKWTRDPVAAKKYRLHYVDSKPLPGLSTDKALIHEGCNSGYQAINLALHRGAKRVLLLGFDAKGTTGKTHFFGRHDERGLPDRPDYGDLPEQFAKMQPEKYGLEVINCTRDTAITCFKRLGLSDALSLPDP